MQEVKISIGAMQSKYWAYLKFEDKNGVIHEKRIEEDRSASMQSNCLQAAIDAFNALRRPCMVTCEAREEYVIEPIKQGWLCRWEKSGWKTAKGTDVKNSNQWKLLKKAMAPHSVRFLLLEDKRK